MKSRPIYLAFFGIVAASGLACLPTVTDSSEVATEEMYCTFSVERFGSVVTATAHFTIGPLIGLGNRPIILTGGDTIEVNGISLVATAPEGQLFQPYEAELEPAETYTFTLTRPGEGTYTSTVTLPAEVSILAPVEDDAASRSEALDIQWLDNGGDTINLSIDHEAVDGYVCLYLRHDVSEETWEGIPDTGTYTMPAGGLQSAQDIYGVSACECPDDLPAVLTLSRSALGDLAPGLTGMMTATAWDEVHFTSAP